MIAVDYIAQTLKARGLTLWTYAGGTICPLFDACQRAGVPVIVARSETGAGFAAIGAAKATRQPQVVAVTSGPGAGGVINAIMDAYYDGVPLIVLTGQVGVSYLAETKLSGKRQSGFQETPIVDVAKPITVMSAQARTPDLLAALFDVAFSAAVDGDRAGPVLLDMPMDAQRGSVSTLPAPRAPNGLKCPLHHGEIERMVELLNAARKPVIIAGAGCLGAAEALRSLMYRLEICVVASLPAVGIVPTGEPLYAGMIGHCGHETANRAVHEADLVLALGARLDMRQTGTEEGRFAPDAKIVRVDKSKTELLGSRVRVDLAVQADCGAVLERLLERDDLRVHTESIIESRAPDAGDLVEPIMALISHQSPDDCIFTTGVGAHQQHAARWLHLDYPRRMFLTSSGHGCMGAGLPMAIGAALATGRKSIVIDGDGSFQMTMNELGTIKRYGLQDQIEIHIIDNGSGGIVSQFARLQGWSPAETTWSTGNPRWETLAAAYGLGVHVHQTVQEGVWPILEAGRTMEKMTHEPI